jgi:rhodanese-related sulfurtransferase
VPTVGGSAPEPGTVARVDREALTRMLEQGAQLVEVLPEEDFEEEHLPGAVNIPLAEIRDRAGELDRSRPVIVYCFDDV